VRAKAATGWIAAGIAGLGSEVEDDSAATANTPDRADDGAVGAPEASAAAASDITERPERRARLVSSADTAGTKAGAVDIAWPPPGDAFAGVALAVPIFTVADPAFLPIFDFNSETSDFNPGTLQ
jgi:hypothetical protein